MLAKPQTHKITKMEQLIKKLTINEHIEFLLQSEKSFAAYCGNLNNFKPFNNKYGYRKGDELIQFTNSLLGKICDPTHDFIEHISGDDFILILQSKNWEQRCNQALASFAQTSSVLFDKKHLAMGGYMTEDRQSRIVHHPLPTLSIGAALIIPEWFDSHYEVIEATTAAKKMAKKQRGNSLFIERRHINPYQITVSQRQKMELHYG